MEHTTASNVKMMTGRIILFALFLGFDAVASTSVRLFSQVWNANIVSAHALLKRVRRELRLLDYSRLASVLHSASYSSRRRRARSTLVLKLFLQ